MKTTKTKTHVSNKRCCGDEWQPHENESYGFARRIVLIAAQCGATHGASSASNAKGAEQRACKKSLPGAWGRTLNPKALEQGGWGGHTRGVSAPPWGLQTQARTPM